MKVKSLFLDVETTGTDSSRHGIIQIAGKAFINGQFNSKFSLKMNPADYAVFDEGAMKWHEETNQITKADILSWEPQKKVFEQFVAALDNFVNKFDKKDKILLYGYNVKFDEQFLRRWFTANGHKYYGSYFYSMPVDVAALAADHLKRERAAMENFKLVTVAKELGVDLDESLAHDAMYDVDLTVKAYAAIKKREFKYYANKFHEVIQLLENKPEHTDGGVLISELFESDFEL